ncbi:MAG: Holliday junction resolvase [Thermoprotei archaeon]|nr:MAG: Holliday junction resolvase [Thermoprotei archaeon]
MFMGSKRRLGFSRERELVRLFWKKGFACIRGPASGAKTRRIIYPDLIALKNGAIFIIEVKTRESKEPIYIDREKIIRLKEFARRAKGLPLIAIKFIGQTRWRFLHVNDLIETPKGNFKVDLEVLAKKGLTIEALEALASKTTKLNRFLFHSNSNSYS